MCFLTFDYTKLNLYNTNYPVKNRVSSSDKGKNQRRNLWHQFVARSHFYRFYQDKKLNNGPNLIT